MAIPNDFIQELISRTDVVDVVGQHVQLKKGGANLMGLCPFHNEKSPSFTVSPSKQFYHCFGCGKNGNAISFLMDYLGLSFIEAVQDLAQKLGMQVPQEDRSPQEIAKIAQIKEKQHSLNEVLSKASVAYKQQLKASPKAIQYLEGRGLTGKIAARFGLGYAPAGWRFLANVFPDYSHTSLVESGLVIDHALEADGTSGLPIAHTGVTSSASTDPKNKRYDRFRDRVMFPIRNVKGETIGFGGRVFGDEKPKYLNSPETPVFHKGLELYGLFEAREAIREKGYMIVTEGYMDVVALAQLGYANAVATLGTACTSEHIRKIYRYCDKVVFSFDGDNAGQRAAVKALQATLPFATDIRSAKFLFLPDQHDPDSFIRANGTEAFETFVQSSVPLSRFLIETASQDCDLSTAEGRSLMASNALPLWAELPDGVLKRQLIAEIAQIIKLSENQLADLWQLKMQTQQVAQARTNQVSQQATKKTAYKEKENALDGYDRDYGYYSTDSAPENFDNSVMQSTPPRDSNINNNLYQQYTQAATTSSWKKGRFDKKPTVRLPLKGRVIPASRADHLLRLLLSQSGIWSQLSTEEHQTLCHMAGSHGALLNWMDAQFHNFGPQPWSALQIALKENPLSHFANQLMSQNEFIDTDPSEIEMELHDLLARIQIDELKLQQTEAIELSSTDAQQLLRWRQLKEEILLLEQSLVKKIKTDSKS